MDPTVNVRGIACKVTRLTQKSGFGNTLLQISNPMCLLFWRTGINSKRLFGAEDWESIPENWKQMWKFLTHSHCHSLPLPSNLWDRCSVGYVAAHLLGGESQRTTLRWTIMRPYKSKSLNRKKCLSFGFRLHIFVKTPSPTRTRFGISNFYMKSEMRKIHTHVCGKTE